MDTKELLSKLEEAGVLSFEVRFEAEDQHFEGCASSRIRKLVYVGQTANASPELQNSATALAEETVRTELASVLGDGDIKGVVRVDVKTGSGEIAYDRTIKENGAFEFSWERVGS